MGVQNQPSDAGTRIDRLTTGNNLNKKLKAIGQVNKSQQLVSVERDGPTPQEKAAIESDVFKASPAEQAQQDNLQETLKQVSELAKQKEAKNTEQFKAASKSATSIMVKMLGGIEDGAFQYVAEQAKKSEYAHLSPDELKAQIIEDLIQNPDQMGTILVDKITSDIDAKRKELQDDPDALAELDEKQEEVDIISQALGALEDNSHVEMAEVLALIPKAEQRSGGYRKLVKQYENDLQEIAKFQDKRVSDALLNKIATRFGLENHKYDKHERKRLMTLTGAFIADGFGGGVAGPDSVSFRAGSNAGQNVFVQEGEIETAFAAAEPWTPGNEDSEVEYIDLVTNSDWTQRLGYNKQNYISQLTKENPTPMIDVQESVA